MSTVKNQVDMINHPPHYQAGGLEAIEIIEAYGLGYHLGNAVKYILRAGRKNGSAAGAIEDLKKANWYLKREHERMETGILGYIRWFGRTERRPQKDWSTRIDKERLISTRDVVGAFGLSADLARALDEILMPVRLPSTTRRSFRHAMVEAMEALGREIERIKGGGV